MSDRPNEYWQPWPGPTGTTGPQFLGVTGAVTGPAFFGVTGAVGPTGLQEMHSRVSYLYDRARVELTGASDAMVRLAMYDMFHEFFNDSSIWQEAIPGLLQPGVVEYFLEPGQVQSLGDAFPVGKIIGLVGVADFNQIPVSATMPMPPILQLQFSQSNTLPVFVLVTKNISIPPSGSLPQVPVWVVDLFEPYLMKGITGKLQLQSDRPYTDLKMGSMNYNFFRQGVNIARVRMQRRNTLGSQGWVFPQQFRTRTQRGFGVSVGSSVRFGGPWW